MPELVFFCRGEEVLRVELERSRVLLGRAAQSDIVLADAEVSLHQAAVVWDGTELLLEDLSGQGTAVSGRKSLRTPLVEGADISLGPWTAVVHLDAASKRPAPLGALQTPSAERRWSARLLMRDGPTLDVAEVQLAAEPSDEPELSSGQFIPGLTLEQMLRQREREIVESALRHFDNNRERVARELGVARSTLFKRLKDWGLTKNDASAPPP
jgi:hypothetical protein